MLKPEYAESRALVVGIDRYDHASPLSYAVSDARAVREALVEDLGFPAGNVIALYDQDATKSAILREYLGFSNERVTPDDRLVVFFAGHGHTVSGYRGEVGYLVPSDGEPSDLSTLIAWDELTGNSELIRAKHVFFIMDACYGGLALTRSTASGSARFLRDMMRRYSRQVLTAGKADEVVADAGGPLPEHSVFTGHLIEGIRGKAVGASGVLTAAGLMAYVYMKVASDKNSRQTPHYGHFDGDGDLVFIAPAEGRGAGEDNKDVDELVFLPPVEEERVADSSDEKIRRVKELLGDQTAFIELHDYVMREVQSLLSRTSEDYFALNGQFSDDELLDRLSRYEDATSDLSVMLACAGFWGQSDQQPVLRKAMTRLIDRFESRSGLTAWLALRWYPAIISFYSAGVASVHGQRFDSLESMFSTRVGGVSHRGEHSRTLVEAMSDAILELTRADVFKRIPGHEKQYVPMSEYLLKTLQPRIDDVLFIGEDYERAFDDFEVLFALSMADINQQRGHSPWGNVGRFGWQEHHGRGALGLIVETAQVEGQSWPPVKAGMFGGKIERFTALAAPYRESIQKMGWW